ncbi:hypothetical protein CA13_62710 [Planctomycetes bacterium CA13]|uniref:Uncharacterized protein n=1 Tax=Novipirellula herctigrandis TaxID=2527986 RepID=A0A5C5ZD89_9BACT|nr:hypothetical protein CA13_62710 [Planctomycetes bacterium CA13]
MLFQLIPGNPIEEIQIITINKTTARTIRRIEPRFDENFAPPYSNVTIIIVTLAATPNPQCEDCGRTPWISSTTQIANNVVKASKCLIGKRDLWIGCFS